MLEERGKEKERKGEKGSYLCDKGMIIHCKKERGESRGKIGKVQKRAYHIRLKIGSRWVYR